MLFALSYVCMCFTSHFLCVSTSRTTTTFDWQFETVEWTNGIIKNSCPHLLHQAKEKFTPGSVFCFVKVEYNTQYTILSADLKYTHAFDTTLKAFWLSDM